VKVPGFPEDLPLLHHLKEQQKRFSEVRNEKKLIKLGGKVKQRKNRVYRRIHTDGSMAIRREGGKKIVLNYSSSVLLDQK